jgi:proteasome accessory factor B
MSKLTFLLRYTLIIRRLEKGAATWDQISEYLQRESELRGVNYDISKRTFQREITEIFSELGYDIVNEKKGDNRYLIKERLGMEHSRRMLEAYETISMVKTSEDYQNYVFFERRKPEGLEHFHGLLHAIRNKKIIEFTYYEYWEEIIRDRIVSPLALKQARGRWYLVGIDTKNGEFKAFGLDRIGNIYISRESFIDKSSYNIPTLFEHSFGIMLGNTEFVRLQFSYEQGQYVKNYPLHHSQKIVSDDEYVDINLQLSITYDFIMELLSYGKEVKIISPASLVNELKQIYKSALEQYK